jgi:hypothetical protein
VVNEVGVGGTVRDCATGSVGVMVLLLPAMNAKARYLGTSGGFEQRLLKA